MRLTILFSIALVFFATIAYPQAITPQQSWDRLMGTWTGEGSGNPGQGSGTFTFAYNLDSNVIVRTSHSEYPAFGTKPAVIHDDLMIIYPGNGKDFERAVYFDNERHVINYRITYADKGIILTSEKMPNTPVFRLTYTFSENGKVQTRFEMSQDGEQFFTYIEGSSSRVK